MTIGSNNTAALADGLSKALADTYALRLRTQGVHWNVEGGLFVAIHGLTEEQYTDMTTAVDDIAERIRAIGHKAPASYAQFEALSRISTAPIEGDARAMLQALIADNTALIQTLSAVIELADDADDEVSEDMMIGRKAVHEKMVWMLRALTA